MAVEPRRSFQLATPEKSPDQSSETVPKTMTTNQKVPVVYYLSRNGQLEHPHFIEVPLSSPDGLFLKDVLHRLNFLRGEGMANLYSWSFKRSYRNGFVWQDLSESDFIRPSQGHEYVLKGSELIQTSRSFRSSATASPENQPESGNSGGNSGKPVTVRRKNQSFSSSCSSDSREYKVYKTTSTTGDIVGKLAADASTNQSRSSSCSSDSREYKVYKTTSTTGDIVGKLAADASTQTGEERGRRRAAAEEDRKVCEDGGATELSRDEISPPCSSSSTETLGLIDRSTDVDDIGYRTVGIDHHGSGRMKVSAALMQLISCGSVAVRDCESTEGKDGDCEVKEHGRRLSCDA